MKKQRFPFLLSPFEKERSTGAFPADEILAALAKRTDADGEAKGKTSRVLASLSLIESSLEELLEKTDRDEKWLDFFRKLIPILDGIDALRDAIDRGGDPSWKRGMDILSEKLMALLEAHGFLRAARVGMAFNPDHHEAVGAQDTALVEPGSIAEVVENGWLYQGGIVRSAKVIVAKGSS